VYVGYILPVFKKCHLKQRGTNYNAEDRESLIRWIVETIFSLSSELTSLNSMVSTIQSKATIANKSCLSSKPNSSLYLFSLSLINLPARLILASSSTLTFMG